MVRHASYDPAIDTCVSVTVLSLRLLADLRRWTAAYGPDLTGQHLETMAWSIACIAPWADAESLTLPARVAVWLYAIDDVIDVEASAIEDVDDALTRCVSIASGETRDESRPVFAALCDICDELRTRSLFGDLSELWLDKFGESMRGMRFAWVLGKDRAQSLSIDSYLEHAASILKWITILALWVCTADSEITRHLDVLVPAAWDVVVAIRLANDLATSAREAREGIGNAVQVASQDWIRGEVTRRRSEVHRRLAPLVSGGYGPAVILARSVDWAVAFYGRADFRVAADPQG
jgi:hypothetical protein